MMENYKKLGLLGEGSHAKVYLVEDQNGHKFALKEFDNSDQSSEEMKSRFLVEREVLKNVDDPHIIQLVDAWGENDIPCLVVELCEYGSLRSQFREIGKFSLRKAVKAGISILRGLELMHKNGVIHRDIKPDNILQGEEGVLKVADMGLAKGTGFEYTHCPQGTVAYMSPEQYSDYNNVDERSDIYSVGATLYHLYTGRELYTGKDIDDILDSHKNCIVPPLTEKRPDCPLSFNHSVRKMIAKNPADRYQTAEEARLDLEAILNGAEAINELPSILKFKEFATSKLSSDANVGETIKSDNNRKNIALIAAVAAVLLITLTLPKSEKKEVEQASSPTEKMTIIQNQEERSEKAPAFFQEESVKIEEPEKITEPVTTKIPTEIKKKEPASQIIVKYKGPVLKQFPCKLLSVSKDGLTCKLTVNDEELSLPLGGSIKNVRVIKLGRKSAVIDFQKTAYEITSGKNHYLFNGLYSFTVNSEAITLSTERKSGGYTLSIIENWMTVTSPEGKKFKFKNNPVEFLIPLSPLKRKKLIYDSKGSLVTFLDLENYYFPLDVQGISSEKTLLTDSKGYRKIHVVNDIVQNRFQVKEISADSVTLKDIKTSKLYELEKGKKLVVRQSALINYKGITHRIADQSSGFFGYEISIENGRVYFTADNNSDLFISNLQKRTLLPTLKNLNSRHLIKNCPCYTEDKIPKEIVKKAIPEMEKVKPVPEIATKLPVENITADTPPKPQVPAKIIIPKPDTEGIQKIRSIDLDYLVKYCDIRFMKIEKNAPRHLANFRFIGDKFLTVHKPDEMDKGDLAYNTRSLLFKNRKFIKGLDGLSVTAADNGKYAVDFIPNNYWSFKEFIKSCRGKMINKNDGKAVTFSYTFDDGHVLIKGNAKSSKKAKVTFNDLRKSISIDKRDYTITFNLGSITLINSSNEMIVIDVDQKKLMGKVWLR